MPFRKGIEDGTDDTEGQAMKARGVEDDVDTEGNMPRVRIAKDGVEDDDTESNIARPGRTIPPSANPGKGIKYKG